jgi:molecular chaperone DnaK (HSP70)
MLVAHVKNTLKLRFGSALQTIDLQFVMTVPAVWSDKAEDATRQAATLAGIPSADLFLVSEPEAAAVYAIQAIQPNKMTVRFHPGVMPERF